MFSSIRRRATYANVAATLALVFAMSGGALAAGGFLIKSITQIKPSVLNQIAKKAKGATGAQGPQGAAGAAGTNGTNGTKGEKGEKGEEGKKGERGSSGVPVSLEHGESEHGAWGYEIANAEEYYVSISFPIPLKEPLEEETLGNGEPGKDVHLIQLHKEGPAECEKGTLADPKAAPGNLCIYEQFGATPVEPFTLNPEEPNLATGAGKSGAILRFEGSTKDAGVWVVTQK